MLRIGAHVGGGGRVARERAEIGKAAGVLELADALELLGDRDDVAGLGLAGERGDGVEDQPVIGAIEILGRDQRRRRCPRRWYRAAGRRARPARLRSNAAACGALRRPEPRSRRVFGGTGHRALSRAAGAAILRRRWSRAAARPRRRAGAGCTTCSPTMRSGPLGRRTSLRVDLEALARARPRRCRGADGAEQLAFGAGLRGDGELEVLQRCRALLGRRRGARAPRFSSSARRSSNFATLSGVASVALPCGQQEVAAVAGLHLDAVADVAEVGDFLQKNDFHLRSPSMLVGVRQQREEARALDRHRELALVEGLRAGDAARHDLARLGDVALERGQILVVDLTSRPRR